MSFPDLEAHVRGTSRYIDDMPDPAGLLHAAAVTSPQPHARLISVDVSAALAVPGAIVRSASTSASSASAAPRRGSGIGREGTAAPRRTGYW